MWRGSAGSTDKALIHRSGTINKAAKTFSVSFPSVVPEKALNEGNVGIGFVILTTNQQLKDGDEVMGDFFESEIVGITSDNTRICIKGDQSAAQ